MAVRRAAEAEEAARLAEAEGPVAAALSTAVLAVASAAALAEAEGPVAAALSTAVLAVEQRMAARAPAAVTAEVAVA